MKAALRIALAGGGTGGHLFPALAIAEAIRIQRPDAEFLFFGTAGKIEARVVPKRGFPFRNIWISGFHRSLRLSNLLFPLKVAVSLVQSWIAMRSFRPDVVVGTGGYVCGPVLLAASMLGIPTVVHESNSYPGVTTRMLAGRATKVLVAFEETRRWLKRSDNVEIAGTPVRSGLSRVGREDGCKHFGLDPSATVILILGGSLGASSLNRAIAAIVPEILRRGIRVVWQTGGAEEHDYRARFGASGVGVIARFIDDMGHAYAAADLVVCRAGASTVAELTALGKASILVPYPHAAADHQTKNARAMEAAGAAVVIVDEEVERSLSDRIFLLATDNKRLATMSAAAKARGKENAGTEIARTILGLLRT